MRVVPAMFAVLAVFTGFALAAPVAARTTLGTFDGWAAFRDEGPPRCFAIAQPVAGRGGSGGGDRPFAAVGSWPTARVRGQFYLRLSRARLADAPITLTIDTQRFTLVASSAEAWAPDPRADAVIVAAMRSARLMRVTTLAATGGSIGDAYALKGAATAIDAAALGCARG